MGNKFIEKHRRKSILATLLFIFRGRVKFVAILLMVTILSVPFVISGEMLGRIIELRPVAAFLRSIGMASVVSTINPKYSNDLLKAAMDKAAQDSENNSFWNRFLKSVSNTMPNGGSSVSSISLIRGGVGDVGPMELKDPKAARTARGKVKGVVNEEEKAHGDYGGEVDLSSLLAGAEGGQNGLYGEVMGENLADRMGGSGNAPYMGGSSFGGGPAVGGRASGMYNKVYSQSGNKVPLPGKPSKVNTKTMGRVSGFSWKNVGYNKKNTKMDVKQGNKRPTFQLAETFAMTGTAYKSKTSAPEYQAAYTGATYDGNDVNLDVIETDAGATTVPDTALTGDLITGAAAMQDSGKVCTAAQGSHGAEMSNHAKIIDDTMKSLGKPPKCCSSSVGRWNAKIAKIKSNCLQFNAHESVLAAACQNKSNPMNCNSYDKMRIKPCSKLKCFLSIILAIIAILIGMFVPGMQFMLAVGVGMLVSAIIPGVLGQILGMIVGLGMGLPGMFAAGGLTLKTAMQGVVGFIYSQGGGKNEEK